MVALLYKTMNLEQKTRLINTVVCLLENTDNRDNIHFGDKTIAFHMRVFATPDYKLGRSSIRPEEVNECGSSCCLVGLGAYLYPEMMKDVREWDYVSRIVFGIDYYDDNKAWDFLFNSSIPNDPVEIAYRLLSYLNGNDPLLFTTDGKSRYKPTLVKKLKAFIEQ